MDQLAVLAQLEKLRSMKSQKALAEINLREARIRRQIATLNEHRKHSHSVEAGLAPMRSIGADVLWQAWIDRTQSDLTTDLARLLVQKEPIMQKAKIDVARKEVAEDLSSTEASALRSELASRRLETTLQMATVNELTPK